MKAITTIFAVLTVFVGTASALTEETPVKLKYRYPPPYPVSCMPPADEAAPPQTVTVMFDVSREGAPQDIRIRESTDACFNEAVMMSAHGWRYEPAQIDGRPKVQQDMEVTVTFILNEETTVTDYDARPITRYPPVYPGRCMNSAKKEETVRVKFDVSVEGRTENIEPVSWTYACLKKSATEAVEKWIYAPKMVAGTPQARPGVETEITYVLDHAGVLADEMKFRGRVADKLKKAQRLAQKKQKPGEALLVLKELEKTYSDSFSKSEWISFYQVRAGVHIANLNYVDALDDLRILRRLGPHLELRKSADKTISQLEDVLGVKPEGPVAHKTSNDEDAPGNQE